MATARLIRDELAGDDGVPFLAELPARGPGADMVGRAMSRLAQVWPAWAVSTTPTGWRLCDAPGRELRSAASLLDQDLDVLEETYAGWAGPLVLPIAGPWTLAATVELPGGERLVRDRGAVRDLVESWGEAVLGYAAEVRRRLPAAGVVVQADEPALPAVLVGGIPTASGAHRYRAVEAAEVRTALGAAVARLAGDDIELLVHCCAAEVPVQLLREVGVAGIGIDLALLPRAQEDTVGECVEAGVRIGLGVVPWGPPPSEVAGSVEQVNGLASRLGFPVEQLAAAVTVGAPCGLAGSSPGAAATALARARAVGRALRGEQDRS
jgi:hypothetical protein